MQDAEGTRIEMKGRVDLSTSISITLEIPPEPHHMTDEELYEEFEGEVTSHEGRLRNRRRRRTFR